MGWTAGSFLISSLVGLTGCFCTLNDWGSPSVLLLLVMMINNPELTRVFSLLLVRPPGIATPNQALINVERHFKMRISWPLPWTRKPISCCHRRKSHQYLGISGAQEGLHSGTLVTGNGSSQWIYLSFESSQFSYCYWSIMCCQAASQLPIINAMHYPGYYKKKQYKAHSV